MGMRETLMHDIITTAAAVKHYSCPCTLYFQRLLQQLFTIRSNICL